MAEAEAPAAAKAATAHTVSIVLSYMGKDAEKDALEAGPLRPMTARVNPEEQCPRAAPEASSRVAQPCIILFLFLLHICGHALLNMVSAIYRSIHIQVAVQAFDKHKKYKDIATFIKKEYETKCAPDSSFNSQAT